MNEKDKAIAQAMASIQNRLRHVYNQGFEDGRKAERKTGKWEFDELGLLCCSNCRTHYPKTKILHSYCSHCGAKMEVDE